MLEVYPFFSIWPWIHYSVIMLFTNRIRDYIMLWFPLDVDLINTTINSNYHAALPFPSHFQKCLSKPIYDYQSYIKASEKHSSTSIWQSKFIQHCRLSMAFILRKALHRDRDVSPCWISSERHRDILYPILECTISSGEHPAPRDAPGRCRL